MSNPEAPPHYWSQHHREQTRREQTTQDAAPQLSDPVIPTWADTNDIIVKMKTKTLETEGNIAQHLIDLKIHRAALWLLCGTTTVIVPLSSIMAYQAFNPTPARLQKAANKLRLQEAYTAAMEADTHVANTTPFILSLRDTEAGTACWKKYTTTPADTGITNTAMLANCVQAEIQQIPDTPGPLMGSFGVVVALVSTVVPFVIVREIKEHTREIAALTHKLGNQPKP